MRYSSWDMEWDDFVILDCFLPFYPPPPPNSPKNENIKKMKKTPGDIIILHNCTKTHDYRLYCSWDMAHDRCNCCFSFWAIFCSFFANFLPGDIIILHNFTQNYCYRLYCSWDMARDGCNCYFLFWAIFYPSNSPKNENFKKMKKIPADIIILHKYTKNHDHMLYCSWDMVHDKCNFFFSFWFFFFPFTPPPPPPSN